MVDRYGPAFGAVLETARVWVNGDDPSEGRATPLHDGDEVAVLPPVSGGCGAPPRWSDRPAGTGAAGSLES